MKAVILCGGQGTRIRDISEVVPKPMLTIGGKPILWHIMRIYAAHGVTEFVLALGYKGWMIREFFLNYHPMVSDCTITLGKRNEIEFHDDVAEGHWRVTLADTGEQTGTGGRLWGVRRYVEGEEAFCFTYGDGVADIDIAELIRRHRASGLVGTISAVQTAGRFGELRTDAGKVVSFEEKPAVTAGRINGGFMVFDGRRVWPYLTGAPEEVFEREPLHRMAQDGQLGCYAHDGRWQCMDTPREYALLNELWDQGAAFWKVE